MPTAKLSWTRLSKPQFDELRQRASTVGMADEFSTLHNEIVTALRDVDRASEKGESNYNTRQPGGQVRHWVCGHISVVYVLFRENGICWILKYQPVPHTWPE